MALMAASEFVSTASFFSWGHSSLFNACQAAQSLNKLECTQTSFKNWLGIHMLFYWLFYEFIFVHSFFVSFLQVCH